MFTGFPQDATDFLWGIRFNNNREWFLENKQRYIDGVLNPINELAREAWAFMTEKCGLDIGVHVARIYRDARRVKSGGPYKDRLWFTLEKSRENWPSSPVFFFEIEPEGCTYGLGYYMAPASTMRAFRARLDANPAEFERLAGDLAAKKIFAVSGESYSRKKDEKEGLLADWYNRKSVSVISETAGHEAVQSADFAKTLCRDFKALIPLYRFFRSLEGGED